MSIPERDIQAALQRIEAMSNDARPLEAQQSSERTPSAARDIQPITGTSLDQAPDVQQAFKNALSTETPLEVNPVEDQRTTSAAKSIDLGQTNAFDQAPNIQKDFTAAQNPQPGNDVVQIPQEQEKTGSEMVENDRPHPYPAPEGPERRPVDREVFDEKWEEAQTNADLTSQQILDATERIKAIETGQGRGLDQGMEMG